MMILVTIVCYFAGLLLIAHITGHKGGSNAAFFKGENKSPWYVVSFGMIGASISGVTFVSVPGMVRGMDMTYMQTVLGFFFGYMIVAHVLLPLYYKLNLTSIYGYLGTRIGVHTYRTGSFFFLLSRMLGTAAKLYLVCLILHTHVFQEMHIPFWVIAVGSVTLVWIYTHKSGIKTIVWTDTLQTFCLIAALLFIIYFTIQKLDTGFDGIVQTIRNSEHSRIFVFDDWISRQNFFKQFFSGIFIVIVMTGLDQDMMQKNLSCRNLREAKKNMYCYGFSFIPLNFLFLCLGILLLALAGQMQLELPAMNDDILPMFATQGYLGQSVLILFTIGIIAASKAKEVIGVELNADAVRDAVQNAKCNDVKNIRFYCNDATEFMMQMAASGDTVDVVLMDPPRAGSTEAFIKAVAAVKAKTVIYVSCGPDTLARDLGVFKKMGYQAEGAWPVDMFPATGHCEVICCLERKENRY